MNHGDSGKETGWLGFHSVPGAQWSFLLAWKFALLGSPWPN